MTTETDNSKTIVVDLKVTSNDLKECEDDRYCIEKRISKNKSDLFKMDFNVMLYICKESFDNIRKDWDYTEINYCDNIKSKYFVDSVQRNVRFNIYVQSNESIKADENNSFNSKEVKKEEEEFFKLEENEISLDFDEKILIKEISTNSDETVIIYKNENFFTHKKMNEKIIDNEIVDNEILDNEIVDNEIVNEEIVIENPYNNVEIFNNEKQLFIDKILNRFHIRRDFKEKEICYNETDEANLTLKIIQEFEHDGKKVQIVEEKDNNCLICLYVLISKGSGLPIDLSTLSPLVLYEFETNHGFVTLFSNMIIPVEHEAFEAFYIAEKLTGGENVVFLIAKDDISTNEFQKLFGDSLTKEKKPLNNKKVIVKPGVFNSKRSVEIVDEDPIVCYCF
ncbi:hypothetical protein HERIO_1392 [Hepatospora eriocheir]|uniref:Uncharacterized protein n=1 Tax=Hepatospora eriocheir TaxID=1081669 RepID=A0A1X0QAG0_9MICR|nr:hypothetical protein HERIO_1392 [Hepatospora eriocheir]